MKRLSDQTLYEILEVPVDAPSEEIDRAYARAVALYGPGSLATYSLVSADEARLLNNRIEEARAVLLDPAARAGYDERIGVRAPSTSVTAPAAPAPPAVAPMVVAPMTPATTPWPPPEPVKVAPPMPPGQPAAPTEGGPALAEAGLERPRQPAPIQLPLPATPLVAEAEQAPAGEAAQPAAAPAAAPIRLERELPARREVVIPEGAAWTGEMLRQVREARGLTTAVLSERTKVIRNHIDNIETDRFGTLPAPVYLRGILMSLARELRLDGQKVARSYLERMAAEVGSSPRK